MKMLDVVKTYASKRSVLFFVAFWAGMMGQAVCDLPEAWWSRLATFVAVTVVGVRAFEWLWQRWFGGRAA